MTLVRACGDLDSLNYVVDVVRYTQPPSPTDGTSYFTAGGCWFRLGCSQTSKDVLYKIVFSHEQHTHD